ncbi:MULTISPECIES: helix-turn-helix domain-containing protein [Salinibaculum]|uniref:helix-turn-helix domain-containing protein n=1 Tax=Salinibaculum TaxID=2732368 RepID=UPI0030CAD26A
MPQAKLRLTIPEEVWLGRLTRDHPEETVRILAALSDADAGVGLAELTGEDPDGLLQEMRDVAEVTSLEVLKRADGEALVQFETTMPLLLLPARDSGVPLEMPFEIRDGTAVLEVTAPTDRLSELGSQLEAFGISYSVDYVQERLGDEQLLTERQRRLVLAAVEQGYYDTPRRVTLTGLAETLDIAKSTASETLHRAEGKIIKQFAAELSEPSRDGDEG